MILTVDSLRSALCENAPASGGNSVPIAVISYFSDLKEAKKQEVAICSLCARIGMLNSPDQNKARAVLQSFPGPGALGKMTSKFDKGLEKAGVNPFLGGATICENDLVALEAIFPIFSSVLLPQQRKEYPNIQKWFEACLMQDKDKKLGLHHHMIGEKRIGSQIDCFPNSITVRQNADVAKEINLGYKKKQTQREMEKAAKEQGKEATTPSSETEEAAPITIAQLGLVQEAAQKRLWDKLASMDVTPYKEENVDLDAKRPVGHSTHNLLVKDKKSKQLYLIATRQSVNANLKDLAKKLNAKELRLARSSKECLCIDNGCITLLSLYNNSGEVVPVIDSKLLTDGGQKLRICSGCTNPQDHSQHNVVDVTAAVVKDILKESNTSGPIYIDFE
uniref:YbaK/aminoacyl-tRNA synthetase-associated domain-containing protein n=1 Tax=Aplanochytrium stocchinoi TaxID=215587 RepID=A0A7S3PPT1_9STRA